jgi:hypothetical protein
VLLGSQALLFVMGQRRPSPLLKSAKRPAFATLPRTISALLHPCLRGTGPPSQRPPGALGPMPLRCAGLQVAPPIMLPVPGKHGHYRVGKVGQKGIAVFLNSRGDMTAYDPQGEMLWQVRWAGGAGWQWASSARSVPRSGAGVLTLRLCFGMLASALPGSKQCHLPLMRNIEI